VPYHVALDLSQEQVKQLKLLATNKDTTVKDLVSDLVKQAVEQNQKKEERN